MEYPSDLVLNVYLVDDNSSDRTGEIVKEKYPLINVIKGSGNLYWAGGMRLAWTEALKKNTYNAFLLLNDDVVLEKKCLISLINTHNHSLKMCGKSGIYVGSTVENNESNISYGGMLITRNNIVMRSKFVSPSNNPQICNFAHANILWVSRDVVNQIGILNEKFIHGIADLDYTLTAYEHKIPLWVVPFICGKCSDDYGNNWKSSSVSLKTRIAYLKSPKGLAYNEYLYYIKKHFPLFYPYSFIMLWLKTLFPVFWERFKK
jgi:GT2 family glycosyltransferase